MITTADKSDGSSPHEGRFSLNVEPYPAGNARRSNVNTFTSATFRRTPMNE